KATRLCDPAFGVMLTWDGEQFRRVAWLGAPAELIDAGREPLKPPPGTPGDRIILGENVVSIADLAADEVGQTSPGIQNLVRFGARSYVAVALRKDGRLVGIIAIYRKELRAFTEKEIALLQNFAAQAVIAMENARLLGQMGERTGDLEESLEYQTATSDVLNVISRSTANVQPVLDTVAETAARLCGADLAAITIRKGEVYRFVASSFSAAEPEYWDALRQRTAV